jgi:hypothetical protein
MRFLVLLLLFSAVFAISYPVDGSVIPETTNISVVDFVGNLTLNGNDVTANLGFLSSAEYFLQDNETNVTFYVGAANGTAGDYYVCEKPTFTLYTIYEYNTKRAFEKGDIILNESFFMSDMNCTLKPPEESEQDETEEPVQNETIEPEQPTASTISIFLNEDCSLSYQN